MHIIIITLTQYKHHERLGDVFSTVCESIFGLWRELNSFSPCLLKATTLGEKEVVAVPLGAHRFLLSPTEEPTVNPEEDRATSPVCRCPPDNHQPVRSDLTHTCTAFVFSLVVSIKI